jgi:hypothetical protein
MMKNNNTLIVINIQIMTSNNNINYYNQRIFLQYRLKLKLAYYPNNQMDNYR